MFLKRGVVSVRTKKLKGFTLVELIIVIAISSILMLCIMAIFKPINVIFQGAAQYDTQRTISDEINTYICESTRYATNIDIYCNYSTIPAGAIQAYTNPITGTPPGKNIPDSDVQIISIINSPTASCPANTINGKTYTGQIYRQKGASATPYEALGEFFYGKQSFFFDCHDLAATDIKITTYAMKDSTTSPSSFVDTSTNIPKTLAQLQAADLISNHAVGSARFANTTVNITNGGTNGLNTYILFTLPA